MDTLAVVLEAPEVLALSRLDLSLLISVEI